MTHAVRVPGELPFDGAALARDRGACAVCGEVGELAPGSDACPACEAIGRAAAEGAVRARAAGGTSTPPPPRAPCETSGRRLSDPALQLLRGEEDRAGGRARCLRCGHKVVLIQGPWLRAVAPAHPAAGGAR